MTPHNEPIATPYMDCIETRNTKRLKRQIRELAKQSFRGENWGAGMPGRSDNTSTEIRIYPNPNCRFAYTLGSEQPVRCTFISDQPLFYTDFDGAMDDDNLILENDPMVEALERDITTLRNKTEAYEKISHAFVNPLEQTMREFLEDCEFMTRPHVKEKAAPQIAALLKTISQSRQAEMYLEFAHAHGVEVMYCDQVADAHYDRDSKKILIRSTLDSALQVLLLSRALRAVWQHKNGSGIHPLSFHPDHAVLVNRAQIADQMIAMVRTAWELQLSGDKSAWLRIENSGLADLGRSFAREACIDFRSLNNGQAANASFESWFLSERCRKADRVLIQQMLADYKGYMFTDNIDSSRAVARELITALGKMPFGKNYLSNHVSQIMADPVFTDVRDRSNANFLWFIKFEHSFREIEEADQAAGNFNADGVSVKEDANRPSCDIIALPVPARADQKSDKKSRAGTSLHNAAEANGNSGNIIYLTAKRDAS